MPPKAGKSPISGDGGATALVSGSSARWARPQHVRWRCSSTVIAADACETDDPARAGVYGSRSSVWLVFSSLKAAASAFGALHDDGQPSVQAASVTVMQSLSALHALRLAARISDARLPLHLICVPHTRDWALWHCKPPGPVLWPLLLDACRLSMSGPSCVSVANRLILSCCTNVFLRWSTNPR